MKVVGYIRVSTDQQVHVGTGLKRQQDAIEKFARDNNFNLVRIFSEQGVSGTLLRSRVALWDMLRYCEEYRPEAVVVERVDRLARDVIICEQILHYLKDLGVALYATDTGTVDWAMAEAADPTRKLIRQVLSAVAEWERAMVVYRLQAGRIKAKTLNNNYALASVSYKQYLIIIIKILARAGLTMREIVKIFNNIKLLTPTGLQWTLGGMRSLVRKNMVGFKQTNIEEAIKLLTDQFTGSVSPEEIVWAAEFFNRILEKPIWKISSPCPKDIQNLTEQLFARKGQDSP